MRSETRYSAQSSLVWKYSFQLLGSPSIQISGWTEEPSVHFHCPSTSLSLAPTQYDHVVGVDSTAGVSGFMVANVIPMLSQDLWAASQSRPVFQASWENTNTLLYLPALQRQSEAVLLPAGALECGGHEMHVADEVAPSVGEYIPAGHAMQVVAPEWIVNVPAAQGAQAPSTGPALPASQSEYCGEERRERERARERDRARDRAREKERVRELVISPLHSRSTFSSSLKE